MLSQIFHQARSSQCLQPNSHPGGRWVEDSFLNHIRALRIFGYAVRAFQQSVGLPSLHQRCLSWYAQQMGHCLHWRHISVLRSLDNHIQHVRAVLQRLIEQQLYAKMEKCEFHQTRASFLGYIISSEGVAMDDKKVQSVLNWPQPRQWKSYSAFGLCQLLQAFYTELQHHSGSAYFAAQGGGETTTRLVTISSAHFPSTQRSFHHRSHPPPSWPQSGIHCQVDASNTGIGAILSQRQGTPSKLFPCAYYSRKLNAAERNYDVGDRELLAMKAAFEEWRHWLEGSKIPFVVLTDHRNLEYIARPNASIHARLAGPYSSHASPSKSHTDLDPRMVKLMHCPDCTIHRHHRKTQTNPSSRQP